MTNLRAVTHLGMGGGGWTESKKLNLDKTDSQPSLWDPIVGTTDATYFTLSLAAKSLTPEVSFAGLQCRKIPLCGW